ncbi:T9SS sorting signal type C domain-containing protein [Flavobacterium polysaccharolyticum]|uniref:T9SS sorting signal type C domain-containing protein n=1 Tax=Flavobacterium polysaccharolyticum TaxID=3133148 RepID=A0ABU9NKN0_9FLAO
MKIKNILLLLLIFSFGCASVFGQQGKVDPTFNTYDDGLLGDGFDNTVRTLSVQGDGKLIVGGDFLNFNGVATPYLCRLLPDGSKDLSFILGTGFNNKVYTCLLQPDGKILVAGSFTQFNGTAVGRLVRLNPDGSRDSSFTSSPGATNSIIYDMALQSDGSIFLAGSFTNFNGTAANRIVKILPNGAVDTSFVIGSGASGLIEKVEIQLDGKIIIGGGFSSFNGVSVGKIARLNANGSLDTSFVTGVGFDNNVSAIGVQSDGKIILGGSFTNYNGNVANRIVRINTDGTLDASFASGTGFNSGAVEAIVMNAGGGLLIGGSFSGTYNGVEVNRVQLFHLDGAINTAFDIGNGPASATVYALENFMDTSWYVGGSFSVFDDQNQGKLAKIDVQGTLDIGYLTSGVGLNNSVSKVLPLSDKSVIVVGNFTQFNGEVVPRITKLNEAGERDSTFNVLSQGANATIRNAAVQSDGKIIIVGNFTSYNETAVNRIARLLPNGSIDATFNMGLGCNGQVYGVAIQSDGKIVIVGNFSTYNGIPAVKIARLLPDGTLDASFISGSGAQDGLVETVALQSDGKMILGGHFTLFNGVSSPRLIRLNADGSVDSSFSVGAGFDAIVYHVTLQSDGKIVVGGSFAAFNGNARRRIVRLQPDGALDVSFVIGTGFSNGTVRTILVQPNGKLLIGGTFSRTYNGVGVKRMLRVHANGAVDGSFSVNLNGTLSTMAMTSDEKVVIGGIFNSVSGTTKHRIARLLLCVDQTKRVAGAWTNGVPTAGKELFFEEDYTIANTTYACNCAIASGFEVKINAETTLALRYQYEGTGLLVVEDGASLHQIDDQISNSGAIQLKRKTTPIRKMDYTYWSSPVQNQRLIDVSPATLSDKFFSFDGASGTWKNESPTSLMTFAKGYIIRGPQHFSTTMPSVYEAVFSGIPNNGVYDFAVGSDQYNLIGNPYPSAIDADLFMTDANNASIIYGALYFWTHNTPIQQSGSDYIYTADDYATYNRTGGTGTKKGAALSGGQVPSGKIASGQSFFVGTTSGIPENSRFQFKNSMRVIDQNTQFFKQASIKKATAIEKNRIWLNLTNSGGAFKQLLVGYIEGATNYWDNLYDGPSFDGQEFVDFYSINQGQNLTIQGRSLPFENTDVVPLGYRSTIAGVFEISIDNREGTLANQEIWLEDKKTNILHELTKEKYIFTAIKGVENDRFVLKYTNVNKSLGTDDNEVVDKSLIVSVKNKKITLASSAEEITQVQVFDLLGRKVYDKSKINAQEWSISNLPSSEQTLIVKTTLANGAISNKKIIF